jgi:hypothetical protein
MGAHGRYVFGSNVLGTGQIGGQSTRLGCAARGLTHTVSPTVLMSVLGHKRTSRPEISMSALLPKADIAGRRLDVRFVPKADICVAILSLRPNRCAKGRVDYGPQRLYVADQIVFPRITRCPKICVAALLSFYRCHIPATDLHHRPSIMLLCPRCTPQRSLALPHRIQCRREHKH